jgi:hypothetical protein
VPTLTITRRAALTAARAVLESAFMRGILVGRG